MAGIDQVFNAAKTALLTSQTGIMVTGHNIANVNTKGFSRQELTIEASPPQLTGKHMIGTGVESGEVRRIYDDFLGQQISTVGKEMGLWKGKSDAFKRVEVTFNEVEGYGLNQRMDDFWGAWSDLVNHPEGTAEREILIAQGESLVSRFNIMNDDLAKARSDFNLQIRNLVTEVNSLSDQINKLVDEIHAMEVVGKNPNDFLDQRDTLLSDLSSLIEIDTFKDNEGKLNAVLSANGKPLFNGVNNFQLTAVTNATGLYDVVWNDVGGSTMTVTDDIRGGGELGGLLEVRDVDIVNYMGQVNSLASEIIIEVNKLHSNGAGLTPFAAGATLTGTYMTPTTLSALDFASEIDYAQSFSIWVGDTNGQNMQEVQLNLQTLGLNGNSSMAALATAIRDEIDRVTTGGLGSYYVDVTESSGALRFTADGTHTFAFSNDQSNILAALGINTFFTGDDASDMGMNSTIVNNSHLIAAGRVSALGEISRGDNSNALAITALSHQATMNTNTATFGEYYSGLVGTVGINIDEANNKLTHQEDLLDQLNTHLEAVAGVSIDEETINLMKFQKAFEAGARLINVAQEMMDTLLSIKE
jgi:flagellar hook-associated protein 1 FlgK